MIKSYKTKPYFHVNCGHPHQSQFQYSVRQHFISITALLSTLYYTTQRPTFLKSVQQNTSHKATQLVLQGRISPSIRAGRYGLLLISRYF